VGDGMGREGGHGPLASLPMRSTYVPKDIIIIGLGACS